MKIAMYGYGNLGKGVESAVKYNSDIELFGVFTRRAPESVRTIFPETKVYSADEIAKYKDEIDVVIICGGSATDLPVMTPMLAKDFSVDFDDAGSIGKRYRRQDEIGTPFCITYDFESETDGCVTVRERDTMEQVRLPISELKAYLAEKLAY